MPYLLDRVVFPKLLFRSRKFLQNQALWRRVRFDVWPDLFNLLGVIILTSLGTWGLPQMVSKFYAIKSGPAIKQGASFLRFLLLSLLGEVISWEDLADCLEIKSPMLLMELLFMIR